MKKVLPKSMYKHFLYLSIAIRILLSSSLIQYYTDYAGQLLQYFVQIFSDIYGKDQIVYNVHSLIHLANDAKQFDVLDNCSLSKYESYLGRLKKLVCSPHAPCVQIVKRIFEIQSQDSNKLLISEVCKFSKPHMNGPLFISYASCVQYKQCQMSKYFISITVGDNCFIVKGKMGVVRNIFQDHPPKKSTSGCIMFEGFSVVRSFFTIPISSDCLSIYYVEKPNGLYEIYELTNILTKCVLLPYKTGYVVLPQMHY